MSSKSDGLKNKIGWNLSRVIGGQSDGAEVYWRHLCGQHQTGPLPLPHPQDVADSTRKGYHHWIHQEWGFQVRHQGWISWILRSTIAPCAQLFYCFFKWRSWATKTFSGTQLLQTTRPVWTGFKIAVRRKLQTHYYKVRCLDAFIICNN